MPTPKTPLMKQYDEMKMKHPDAVLLFRVGDFYETFREDAVTASEILGITLTKRANGVKGEFTYLAGFPHHALDMYLPKLVRAGKRVAICEQLEDPKQKPMAKRKVTELITPLFQPKPAIKLPDISSIVSFLSVFKDILHKLYLFEELKLKTRNLEQFALN